MSTGKYKKTKQHKENLRKALKKYWSDTQRHDDWTAKIKEGVDEYWENKPEDEFVLGKRIRQKIDGIRDAEGYREYMAEYQKKWRESHKYYYAYLKQKKSGKTVLEYEQWIKTYIPYKRINKENQE